MAVEAVGAAGGISSSIRPLWDTMPLSRPEKSRNTAKPETVKPFAEVFDTAIQTVLGRQANPVGDLFRTAAQSVRETDAEKVYLEYLDATGQLDNPALLNIASSKAQLSVNLMIQLRNRAVDAYNELMRISV